MSDPTVPIGIILVILTSALFFITNQHIDERFDELEKRLPPRKDSDA